MERCNALINRLKEQYEARADASAMLVTVQLLHAELARQLAENPPAANSSLVSVTLPGMFRKSADVPAEKNTMAPAGADDLVRLSADTRSELPEGIIFPLAEQPGDKEISVLDPVLETPTLAHQDEIKELNEKMGKLSGESLNDRLKTAGNEISSFLTDTPVRELKKAIGVNDRFLFINELFRGDVDMYERSIKTINNFRILPEAEYWIERELKIKLGWDNDSETTKLFYQLVKRRFS